MKSEHSKLGASSAERWMKCPGSVALVDKLPKDEQEDDEYRAEGKMAHALGAYCLEHRLDAWEGLSEFPGAGMEMSSAVQVYLDHGTHGPSTLIEHKVQHPAFHKDAYGTVDRADFDPEPNVALEVIDYKHGIGVLVDIEGNVQTRCYAFYLISGETWPAKLPRLEDMARIKLTIVQPRGFHPDGPVRSEIITAGELRNWAYNELLPAMKRAGTVAEFKMGEWCRFCPAKEALVCPEQRKLGTDAALAATELEKPDFDLATVDDEWLGAWYARMSLLDMFKKSIRDEAQKRALRGVTCSNWKLVYNKVDRVWKPTALLPSKIDLAPIDQYFGEAAWTKPERPSPAAIEELPGGKDFCAEWAEKPKAGLGIAPISDRRAAQKFVSDEEMFAGVDTGAEQW